MQSGPAHVLYCAARPAKPTGVTRSALQPTVHSSKGHGGSQEPSQGQIVSPWNGQDIYWGQRDRSLLYTSVSASMYYPIPTLSIRLTPLCPAAVSLMWPQLRSSHVLVPSTCAEQDRREGKGCAHRRHTAKIGLTTPFPAWTSREQRAADGGLLISHSMALEDARRRACLSASC